MEYVQIALASLALIGVIVILSKLGKMSSNKSENFDAKELDRQLASLRTELNSSIQTAITNLKPELDNAQTNRTKEQNQILTDNFLNITQANDIQSERITKRLSEINDTVQGSLNNMREDNNKKLEEMRKTVDEKLQTELSKRFTESFANMAKLLSDVDIKIGGMQALAEDVGGLKRTLSNVKARGMMGEFQLENLLADIFSAEQYVKNASTSKESSKVVEFALKIPTEDNDFVLLPIDSKFPIIRYEAVLQASDACDKAALEVAQKAFCNELLRAAKDISEKYIEPPHTTDYAIMFLPTESMYAEAINQGMLETVFRTHKVYITGPSTIAAFLSSMQMAFNNQAIQRRAGEVFGILNEVKQEFSTFEGVLTKMQKHLNLANDDLGKLMGVRSRNINKKLNSINRITGDDDFLELPSIDDDELNDLLG
ncbi:MAG: DNA recombination protein RmuC [Clostridiales bacterium]|nr:DNA recombination protein RmuC [Clostridiales bacterium]